METGLGEHDCQRLFGDEQWGSCNLLAEGGINLHVRGISCLYIDAEVTKEDGFLWWLTGFYGEPSTEKKYLSWKALRTLNAARRRPWLCLGDFNEILLACEKEGGLPRGQSYMDRF